MYEKQNKNSELLLMEELKKKMGAEKNLLLELFAKPKKTNTRLTYPEQKKNSIGHPA